MSPSLCPHCHRAHPLHRCATLLPMSADAHDLLDRAAAGEDVDADDITAALRVTGDLAGAGEPLGVPA